jgi:hypothetical protein
MIYALPPVHLWQAGWQNPKNDGLTNCQDSILTALNDLNNPVWHRGRVRTAENGFSANRNRVRNTSTAPLKTSPRFGGLKSRMTAFTPDDGRGVIWGGNG